MSQAETVAVPKRWPLVISPENRSDSTDKDARLVNCFCEKQKDGSYWIYKRAGLSQLSRPPAGNAAGAGMFNWLGDIYAVFGAVLYKNGVNIGAVNAAGGVYRFKSCLGATPKLQLGNGLFAYNYDSGAGLVLIVDADFPVAFCKGWAYIDGTTYVMRPDAGIQGDDLNDPTSWDPLNVITAQISPDQGVFLENQLVYALAFKQFSVEVFYDAGNSTGSPLGTVQGARASYGCVSGDSVQIIDDIAFWVCTNQSASSQIIKMEGLKVEIISTDPVERLLDGADFSTVYSMQFKDIGHRFYILTVKQSNLTLVYDIDEKMWHQWTDASGNYFPFVATTYDSLLRHQFQHETNGRIYLANEGFTTDNGELITVDIYTPNLDGETRRGKQLNMMYFDADQEVGSVLQVRSNDNDYAAAKWSNFRAVDLSVERPSLDQEGTFNRRAYNFRHAKQTRFRIKAVDLQIDLCTI